jgi:hypothetical protein
MLMEIEGNKYLSYSCGETDTGNALKIKVYDYL